MKYYLAIDIGASSGRHILYWREQSDIHMQEIYRFENHTIINGAYECWDVKMLVENVKQGMKKCLEMQRIPVSVAIDTWGVDYVLLDERGELMHDCICYRDHCFDHIADDVFSILPRAELYAHTGIQFQQFNTIYQLYLMTRHMDINKAQHFLMMPDYLNYVLTGIACNEYTNATTTQLVNARKRTWDKELLQRLHYPEHIFHELRQPGTCIGPLIADIAEEIGYETSVWTCASHDTASAFLMPYDHDTIIISSGTWSLIGVHRKSPRLDGCSMEMNYTNEGGFHTIRYLKNIMGLWLLQELQRVLGKPYSFTKLCELGEASNLSDTVIDVNDPRFLRPDNIMSAIQEYCLEYDIRAPQSIGEYVQCICRSLAVAYAIAIQELEELEQKTYTSITIIGGGVQNEYLNGWIETICHKPVIRGVVEASASGNALMQMYGDGAFSSLDEARACNMILHASDKEKRT